MPNIDEKIPLSLALEIFNNITMLAEQQLKNPDEYDEFQADCAILKEYIVNCADNK